ncbi:extracellular solute-binding protein [Rhizobium redzepovicii]|uniref:sn-glycerol-3-phosphate-binding periplasmic protein UgpB n=1 Tax=Rhizobium redzepovicii TaxID=2867518 RepID=A0AAW8P0X0_9HYPH|nr:MULTISPECIES: extracellular solute-binding protein [Rhizobium]MBY4593207.1 extracellular solute-binding protein [Rhizobium redzepovicii]MBY4617661.1 extracellular solute-binding protein [Rhizobium redzepovicii]MDF0659490.1 extracellular solute-binding protein [Rhizobium sp. BC49]MDR9760616.1 extracellular solute-binding protein [Rhizobium redzepovicii]PDS81692.1 ABC transporter substrate-binding protein [Rhizobium sp. L18]
MTAKSSIGARMGRTIRSFAAGAALVTLGLANAGDAGAADRIKIEWWNAAGGRLAEITNKLIADFNASQDKYEVVGIGKGNYEETMAAMVAAYRVHQQPVLIQAAERGFLTMYNSGAVIPVPELMEKEGYKIDWNDFLAPVAGFYLVDGKPAAMPFNSSTPIFWYNADHFKAAGFDKPGETWQELDKQLGAIKEKGVSKCQMALANDFYWSLIENYAAIQDQPYGTKANGFGGLDTEFIFNKSPLVVGQVTRLKTWLDAGILQIAGQGLSPDQLFTSGTCSTYVASTAAHAAVESGAKFNWSATFLPHEEGIEPKNSTIGGGALWVLKGKSEEEYAGAAAFLNFLASPKTQVWWSKQTGYVPVTNAAYEQAKSEGYFKDHPTREIAILQLTRGTPTDNSRGFRFGNHNQSMALLVEEIQGVWTGQKTPQQALDAAAARGNLILRQYEQLHAAK